MSATGWHAFDQPQHRQRPQRPQPVFVGAWEKVRAEANCRFCQRPWDVRPPTRHHIVPQSYFKSAEGAAKKNMMNSGRNVVGLCRACHDRVDNTNRDEKMRARRELRKLMTQAEIAFAIELRSREWLNRNYPLWEKDELAASVAA